jgi:hypothetical protein
MYGSWELYKPILELCVNKKSSIVRSCLQNISHRNRNLLPPVLVGQQQRALSLQRLLINNLDSTSIPYIIEELWQKCCNLGLEHDHLIRCLCQWATTTLRVGVHRVFVVAGLLRCARASGVNVQDHIISFMVGFGNNVKGNKRNVYLLVSELVRSKIFSVASYMKWLISRGILSNYSVINDVGTNKLPASIKDSIDIVSYRRALVTSVYSLKYQYLAHQAIFVTLGRFCYQVMVTLSRRRLNHSRSQDIFYHQRSRAFSTGNPNLSVQREALAMRI